MARKKKEEPQGGASWLNTFADLMNLLLCFFVLLFAMSSVDTETAGGFFSQQFQYLFNERQFGHQ